MPNETAPTTSLRPKARRRLEDEGSTRHPGGNLSDQGAMTAAEKRAERRLREDEGSTRHPSGKNIDEQDTQMFMGGGMAKRKYMMGGEVRRADVRDNPKRGKTY